MGTIFEELIRKFNEALNENPGEHFTPRDVVYLMANLLIAGDAEIIKRKGAIVTVYDPCCGSGGMLTITKDEIHALNPHADAHLFGQEVNPETFAVCKSDLFIKDPSGHDADNIAFGSTLSDDKHRDRRFDYLITNPPYGKEWKRDEEEVRRENERGPAGRFEAGLPRISDGQLLFLQHMLSHMRPVEEGGSRVCIIMNGSSLFTGDAGSGESEIRRWILENDWLEALIALPEQLFYNTGIATYIWVLTNRKERKRRGKVLLIDATSLWEPMGRSLGDKRRKISDGQVHHTIRLYNAYREREDCRILPCAHFGYRKITVERPLGLNFQASPGRIARLEGEKAFSNLAVSKKKDPKVKEKEEAEGRARREAILAMLRNMPQDLFKDRDSFEEALKESERRSEVKLTAPLRKSILSALSERDETAGICRYKEGNPEPDPELRDTENVPLSETVEDHFTREVKPYVPDAWTNEGIRDHKDGEVGKVGYEINFNRYFHKYEPPRPLEEIEADIRELEREITRMLREITRWHGAYHLNKCRHILSNADIYLNIIMWTFAVFRTLMGLAFPSAAKVGIAQPAT